jgi:hypothetical protein
MRRTTFHNQLTTKVYMVNYYEKNCKILANFGSNLYHCNNWGTWQEFRLPNSIAIVVLKTMLYIT